MGGQFDTSKLHDPESITQQVLDNDTSVCEKYDEPGLGMAKLSYGLWVMYFGCVKLASHMKRLKCRKRLIYHHNLSPGSVKLAGTAKGYKILAQIVGHVLLRL